MLLTPHLLVGAAVASKTSNPILGIFLAFLSHYLLDFIPHAEYSIEKIHLKKWGEAKTDFVKIAIDSFIGIATIYILPGKTLIIFIGAAFAVLPDLLSFMGILFNNKLLHYNDYLQEKIHFLRNIKIPLVLGVLTQLLAVVTAIFLLL